MKVAEVYSELSYAQRLKVGCVIVKDNKIISIGYNGTPSGWDNDCEDENNQSKNSVIHAEQNALMKVAQSNESCVDADIFITHAPCIQCAKLIGISGIKNLYYKYDYRCSEGLDFLRQCGITIVKV